MTRMLTCGLILALTLTLTPPPTQAACAWVLWRQTYVVAKDGSPLLVEWEAVDSFGSEQACKENRATSERRTSPMPTQEGRTVMGYYSCFPDTIDPRAPRR